MCLIALAWNTLPDYPLVMIANRDEFHERPTAPLMSWDDSTGIIAGRDLEAGGTWLGFHRDGRFAALTNVRGGKVAVNGPSRGELVTGFLSHSGEDTEWLESLETQRDRYTGFNLLFGRIGGSLGYLSNHAPTAFPLAAGFYGLSNAALDTDWPKTTRLTRGLEDALSGGELPTEDTLLALLHDKHLPHDDLLPATGVGLEKERMLAPAFIVDDIYGTRSSSIISVNNNGEVSFSEYRYNPRGEIVGHSGERFVVPNKIVPT